MYGKIKGIALILVTIIAINGFSTFTIFAENETEYAEFFSLINLELPQLSQVKKSVIAKDYLTATGALLNYYKTRTSPIWYTMPRPPRVNTSYNTEKAEQILRHQFTYNALSGCPDVSGSNGDINWLYSPNGDKEWYWALNRQYQLKELSVAYQETSNAKYAIELEKQFLDWYGDNPCPAEKDDVKAWRTLEAGIRMGDTMFTAFNNILYCDGVSDLSKLRMLNSFQQHGEYLTSFSGTGNWLLFECRGLYALSVIFPEFKGSAKWKNAALQRLNVEVNTQFLDDGWQYELTPNYHIESVKSIYAVQELASMNGEILPFADKLLNAYDTASRLVVAGGRVSPLNDTGWIGCQDVLYQGAKLAQEIGSNKGEGFLSVASAYSSSSANSLATSHQDEIASISHMRDFNGRDGIYAMLEAGDAGVGPHGWSSRDKLQFTLSAFDRDLLIDPGVYSYTNEPIAKYMYTTSAHNTVTVDGYDQIRRGQDLSAKDKGFYASYTGGLDYSEGLYDETFDEIKKIPVTHKRKVVYVKSGYFVIRDELAGSGNHIASQNWNFAPGEYTLDTKTGVAHTNFSDGANVLLIPLKIDGVKPHYGEQSPIKGWSAAGTNVAVKTLNLEYVKSFNNVGNIDTLVIPYTGLKPPKVAASTVDGGICVDFGSYTDNIVFGSGSGYGFDGKSAVVRRADGVIVNMSKCPPTSNLLYNNVNIVAPEIACRKENVKNKMLKNNGTVQAEWNGGTVTGNGHYIFDTSAVSKMAVRLETGANLQLSAETGVLTAKVKVKGNGKFSVLENNVVKNQFVINQNTYKIHDVALANGGNIMVKCDEGDIAVDQVEFVGSDETKINQRVVRQRLPVDLAEGILTSVNTSNYDFSADLMVNSSLSNSETSAVGIGVNGNIKLKYDLKNHQIQLWQNSVSAQEISAELKVNKWYTFRLSLSNNNLRAEVKDRETQGVMAVFTAVIQPTSTAKAAIFTEYADCSADNILWNGGKEDFERTFIGGRPNNWVDGAKGSFRVEPYEHSDEAETLGIRLVSKEILEGTGLNLDLVIPNGYENVKLYQNGEIVQYTEGKYACNPQMGRYVFRLEGEFKGQRCVSDNCVVNIRQKPPVNQGSAYLNEEFNEYTGGLISSRWLGTAEYLVANFVDNSKCMELKNNVNGSSEVYYTFASAMQGKVLIEGDFVPNSSTSSATIFVMRDNDGTEFIPIEFEKGGNIINKSSGQRLCGYEKGKKYNIILEIDCVNHKFDAYINGYKVCVSAPINAEFSDIKKLYVAKLWKANSSILMDNINVVPFNDLVKIFPVNLYDGGVLVDTYEIWYQNGDPFIGIYNKNKLKEIKSNGESINIDVNNGNLVKFFNWDANMTPLKPPIEFYLS